MMAGKRKREKRCAAKEPTYGPPPPRVVEKKLSLEQISENVAMHIRLLERAHERTAKSTLRFGPPTKADRRK
jgi:hypothetical protein